MCGACAHVHVCACVFLRALVCVCVCMCACVSVPGSAENWRESKPKQSSCWSSRPSHCVDWPVFDPLQYLRKRHKACVGGGTFGFHIVSGRGLHRGGLANVDGGRHHPSRPAIHPPQYVNRWVSDLPFDLSGSGSGGRWWGGEA